MADWNVEGEFVRLNGNDQKFVMANVRSKHILVMHPYLIPEHRSNFEK